MTGEQDAVLSAAASRGGPHTGELLAERYRIEALIGTGGMSAVYRASDTSLGRTVAIKLFRLHLAGADDVRRQHDEVRLLASLNHPTLVTLFDAVPDVDGRAFLVLEFVDGRDLGEVIRSGPVASEDAAAIGADVADALAWIHERGIVHRDVKPGNVLIPHRSASGRGPRAKLADFGIARLLDDSRLTTTGSIVGTASYLSPEQAAGQPTESASDVYSLGLVLLECLTGERPFGGSGIESVLARLHRDPLIPESLGRDWVRLLALLTAREPAERLTAGEARVHLADISQRAVPRSDGDPTLRFPSTDATAGLPAAYSASLDSTTPDSTAPGFTHPDSAHPDSAHLTSAQAAAASAETIVLAPARRSVSESSRDESEGRRMPRASRRRIVLVAAALAIVVAATVGAIGVASSGPDEVADPTYPAIEGDLGDHLEQLQRSVDR